MCDAIAWNRSTYENKGQGFAPRPNVVYLPGVQFNNGGTMTVAQLIRHLEAFTPTDEVWVRVPDSNDFGGAFDGTDFPMEAVIKDEESPQVVFIVG